MACTRKHLLITGTSSGIGKATMEAALEAGYNPLANKRVAFQPDNKPAVANGAFPRFDEFPHPTYLARNALYDGGIIDFVRHLNSSKEALFKKVGYYEQAEEDQEVEIAFQ